MSETVTTGVLIPRPAGGSSLTVPAIIADAGDHAARRFLEFFTANIANANTHAAHAQTVGQFLSPGPAESKAFDATLW